jgi:hypothetical protein
LDDLCSAEYRWSEMFINVADNAIFPPDCNRIAFAQQQDLQLAALKKRSPQDFVQ